MLKFDYPPIKILLIAWALIFINYILGPIDHPFPSLFLLFYLASAALAVIIGFSAGFGTSNRSDIKKQLKNNTTFLKLSKWNNTKFQNNSILVVESLNKIKKIVLVLSIISALGSGVAFRILNQSGRTIQDSIEITGLVRQTTVDDLGYVSVIANTFGFMSMSLIILAVLYILYNGGPLKPFNIALSLASATGVVFLLLSYVVNVNRTAFLILILFTLIFPYVFLNGDILGLFKKIGKIGILFLVGILVIIIGYIFFIAIKRSGGDSDNDSFIASFIKNRYSLPFLTGDLNVAFNKLFWYSSHQFSNLDLILNSSATPYFAFEPSQLFFWIYQQLGKFIPELSNAFLQTSVRSAEIAELSGAYSWQWNTGFCAFIFTFGILGSVPALFLFSVSAGYCYYRFCSFGSVVSGLLCLWLVTMGVLLFVYFPVDNFIQSNFFYLFSLNSVLISFGFRRP